MDCLTCRNLYQIVGRARAEYAQARSAAFYTVSTEIAAKSQVDMEHAKADLRKHRSVCSSTPKLEYIGRRRNSPIWLEHGGLARAA
jgi:predicted anti-sigma-YlaC factor YlaD